MTTLSETLTDLMVPVALGKVGDSVVVPKTSSVAVMAYKVAEYTGIRDKGLRLKTESHGLIVTGKH